MSVIVAVAITEFDYDVLRETALENALDMSHGEHILCDRSVNGYGLKTPLLEYPIVFSEDGTITYEAKNQKEKDIAEAIISLYTENLIRKKIFEFAVRNLYYIEEDKDDNIIKLKRYDQEIQIELLRKHPKISFKGFKGKECEEALNSLLGNNGQIVEKQYTEEYYQSYPENKNRNILDLL